MLPSRLDSHHPIYLVLPVGVPRLIQGGFPEPGSACSSPSPPQLPWRTRTRRRRDCSGACPGRRGLEEFEFHRLETTFPDFDYQHQACPKLNTARETHPLAREGRRRRRRRRTYLLDQLSQLGLSRLDSGTSGRLEDDC